MFIVQTHSISFTDTNIQRKTSDGERYERRQKPTCCGSLDVSTISTSTTDDDAHFSGVNFSKESTVLEVEQGKFK